jgi:hypothetical protein
MRVGAALVLCTALLSGCSRSGDASAYVVRDSAGIEIVEHGRLTDHEGFRISEPTYRTGWGESDPAFQRIFSGVLLSGGQAVVGDIETGEAVFLDSDGSVQAVVGGSGEGPGEVRRLMSVSRLDGDTVIIEDDGNVRLSYFHGGEWVRAHQFSEPEAALNTMGFGLIGRDQFVTASWYVPFFEEPWLEAPIVRHRLDTQQWDTIGFYDFMPRIPRDRTPNPFRGAGYVALTPSAVVVGRGDRSEIELLDPVTGATSRIIRWQEEPRTVTDDLWSSYIDWVISRTPGSPDERMLVELDARRRAASAPLPYLMGIAADPAGRIWVSEFARAFPEPHRYRVFSADGAWLGWAVMPPRFRVLDIGTNRILGVQRNELDIEAVAIVHYSPSASGLCHHA